MDKNYSFGTFPITYPKKSHFVIENIILKPCISHENISKDISNSKISCSYHVSSSIKFEYECHPKCKVKSIYLRYKKRNDPSSEYGQDYSYDISGYSKKDNKIHVLLSGTSISDTLNIFKSIPVLLLKNGELLNTMLLNIDEESLNLFVEYFDKIIFDFNFNESVYVDNTELYLQEITEVSLF